MATISSFHRAAIVNLYSALFNRAPDASGLNFWAQAHADGAALATLTQSFLGTVEGRASYPAAQNSAQFVAAFYQTVFGRTADAGGLAFWTASLDRAGGAGSDAARAILISQIVTLVNQPLDIRPEGIGDAAYRQTVADRALFANKATVGDYVVSLNINDVVLARHTLALVTADPASVALAKAFALYGGGLPAPPSEPDPIYPIIGSGTATELAARFAAYQGNQATIDVTGMDASKLAVVVAAIAKIASGGISGVLGLDVAGYASASLPVMASKFAAGLSLNVTGSAGQDIIDIKEFQRATTIDGGAGNDVFDAVVDADTPANTTLGARHTLVGGTGLDMLRIVAKGNVADLFHGASVSGIEAVYVQQLGGAASISANANMVQIGVTGAGDLSANNMRTTLLILDGTASTGNYTLNTVGTSMANLTLMSGAQAKTVTVGGSATTLNLYNSGPANLVTSLVLADGIDQLDIRGSADIAIMGTIGNVAGGLAITISGTGMVAMSAINSPVTSLSASTATGRVVAVFNQAVQTVVGGSAADIISISKTPVTGGSTLTGNAGADVFVLRAGVGLAGAVDNASLLAKVVTITDFSVGDQLEIEATVRSDPNTSVSGTVRVVAMTAPTSLLDAVSQAVAGGAAQPYLGFVYQATSYLLVDNHRDGLGAGDVLVKLTGVNLANVSYTDGNLTTV